MKGSMAKRAILCFVVAAAITLLLLLRAQATGVPGWTAWVGGMGAGVLAMMPVLMSAPDIEAAATLVGLLVVGWIVRGVGVPAWMFLPFWIGPVVGYVLTRAAPPSGSEDAES